MVVLMVQPVFAAFPDPEKDPRHYLVRYYTEPDYQAWFDKSYPNDTIEDKVGYSKKIVTDDYYVNSFFDFAMKYPSGDYEIDEKALTAVEGETGVVSFFFGGNSVWWAGYVLHYDQIHRGDFSSDLLYAYSTFPAYAVEDQENVSVQMKVTNETWESDGTRDIIRYEFFASEYYSDDHWDENMRDIIREKKYVTVILLYPNDDQYQFIFDSPQEAYSEDVKEFDKIVDSFYAGETEKLSDLLADYAPEVKSAAAESSMGCGPGTVLVNGVCELKQEVKSEPIQTSEGCGPGTTMVNGVCELKEASSTYQSPLHWWHIVAVLAIGGIIAGVVVVNRGSKSAEPKEQPKEEPKEQPKEEPKEQPKEEPKEQLSRFCENCGNKLKPTAKFCGKCGTQRS